MASIKAVNTKPELIVRRYLYSRGLRYRIHKRGLPGTPDIVFLRHKIAIFVHGCFWHGHNCKRGHKPKTNTEYWQQKIEKNMLRDKQNRRALQKAGWRVIVVWECDLSQKRLKELVDQINQLTACTPP